MMIHELKCSSSYFDAVWDGRKLFELRYNDRNFAVGDDLLLVEVDDNLQMSGRRLIAEVTYLLSEFEALLPRFVAMSIHVRQRFSVE